MKEIIIRHARRQDSAGIATVQVKTWQSAYSGLISQSHLDSLDISAKTEQWKLVIDSMNELIFVAEFGGCIVGFITGGLSRSKKEYIGEITAFYVLDVYQGIGLGTKLFEAMNIEFKKKGYNSFYTWVLYNGPARKFYEKRGGVYIDEKIEKLGDIEVKEISYGWKNI